MRAITNLYQLEKILTEKVNSYFAAEIIEGLSVEIYHEWTNEDIARKALEMFEKNEPSPFWWIPFSFWTLLSSLIILSVWRGINDDSRDGLVDFLLESEDFNIEEVGDKFADAWDASEIGVNWATVEWAITEIHTIDKLIGIVAEGITEIENNDSNAE